MTTPIFGAKSFAKRLILNVGKEMYIRFIVTTDHRDKQRCTGVIASLRILRDEGILSGYHEEFANEVFDSLNNKLPCPPFSKNNWKGCVSWFKDTAREMIDMFRDIVAILEEHDHEVKMLTTDKPGMIVYEDAYQVVAKSKYY